MPSVRRLDALLTAADWSNLHHAYGRAADTPIHLAALLSSDSSARTAAMQHLWSAVIHQDTAWTVTGEAAKVVAEMLFDERLDNGDPIRSNLVSFLVSVARASQSSAFGREELEKMAARDISSFLESEDEAAMYEDEEATDTFFTRALLGCIKVVPLLLTTMLRALDDPNPSVRACAAMGAAELMKIEALRRQSNGLELKLKHLAQAAEADERCALVLAIGDLGGNPKEFMNDPSPAVRMCAALAPTLASDPVAISELLCALEYHAEEIDGWFIEKPPQFPMCPRFKVVARLVEQVKNFDQMAGAAVSTIAVTQKMCVDNDWGPLMAAAFPDGRGQVETEGQRNFLEALVARVDLWDPKFGNANRWFKQAGLPNDHALCIDRLRQGRESLQAEPRT